MSNLTNLTEKIIATGEARAKEILDAAGLEADEIIRQKTAEGEAERERILSEAKLLAERASEQVAQSRELETRDLVLSAKQETLERVFALALERLNDMPKEDYLKFLGNSLARLTLSGETLTVPKKYGITNIDEVLKAIPGGASGSLTLDTSDRDVEGGFILSKDGIEQNSTFRALLEYYRLELEPGVLSALF